MSAMRPVVIGWVLLVAGGWAATLWLGEPSATAGPGPASGVSADNPEPGPQPEGSCGTPEATPSPPPSSVPSPLTNGEEYKGIPGRQVVCDVLVYRDHVTAR